VERLAQRDPDRESNQERDAENELVSGGAPPPAAPSRGGL